MSRKNTEVLDQQWVADYPQALALQDQLASAAASRGLVVGVSAAGRYKGDGYLVTVERPWCPDDCGCRLGPDANGDHDADRRECGCDGPCTEEG